MVRPSDFVLLVDEDDEISPTLAKEDGAMITYQSMAAAGRLCALLDPAHAIECVVALAEAQKEAVGWSRLELCRACWVASTVVYTGLPHSEAIANFVVVLLQAINTAGDARPSFSAKTVGASVCLCWCVCVINDIWCCVREMIYGAVCDK